jgi:hypothetical protein
MAAVEVAELVLQGQPELLVLSVLQEQPELERKALRVELD